MLTNFNRLNEGYITIDTQEELIARLTNSHGLRDALFEPIELQPPFPTEPINPFYDKKFTNVSFGWTTITGITFRSCEFIDCLFLWTRFVNCEFHDCTFKDSNPHKVEFENTYIDPSVFVGMLNKRQHSNIGIHLFHQLYDNSVKMNQREFTITAEFNRHKWKRYSLDYQERERKKKLARQYKDQGKWMPRLFLRLQFDRKYLAQWFSNILSWVFLGYGIRFKFVLSWMFAAAVISILTNFFGWEYLSVVGRDGQSAERGIVKVVYYTATIPSGLGDFTPASDIGKVVFLGEGLLGFIIVSLFATWLVKRCMR